MVIKDGLNVSAAGPSSVGDHSQNAETSASLVHISGTVFPSESTTVAALPDDQMIN